MLRRMVVEATGDEDVYNRIREFIHQNPRVCIYNAEYDMTMIDLLSGDVLWEISYDSLTGI